jgi:NO-binding membrane sensor protein with MHYT domain
MLRILVTIEHDWRLVVGAGIIARSGRDQAFHRARDQRKARLIWIVTAGAATGSGIWATHFIAMLAYGQRWRCYNTGLTALSLLLQQRSQGQTCRCRQHSGARRRCVGGAIVATA